MTALSRRRTLAGLLLATVALQGCVSGTSRAPGTKGSEGLSAWAASCENLGIEENCSFWSGASQHVVMYDFRMRIAVSDNRRRILVMADDDDGIDALAHAYIAYELLKRKLHEHDIGIERAEPIEGLGFTVAYIVDTDRSVSGIFEPFVTQSP